MGAQQATLWDWADPKPAARSRLRPYQDAAIAAIWAGQEKHRTGIVVCPTGTGKTVIAAEGTRQWFERPNSSRVLFLAESRQILRQAAAKLEGWTGRLGDVGLEQAGNYAGRERIVCASRQTLANPMRLERLMQDPPGLIWVDECHHVKPKGEYADILKVFPKARVVGLTATPDRADKQALLQSFETTFFKYEIDEAITDGWLVPVVTPTITNWEALDISRIRKTCGELNEAELEKLLSEVVKDQGRAVVKACGDRKTIVYCGRVETAHAMAEVIRKELGNDHAAQVVSGDQDDDAKDAVLDAYRAGEFQYLVNVGICVEGFDDPPTAAVAMTRPYLSRNRFAQVCGRPLRPLAPVDDCDTAAERRAAIAASTKPNAALINFRFIKGKHTLVCPEDVLGGKYSDAEKKRAGESREQDPNLTVGDSLAKAKEQLGREAIEAERARKAKLAAEAQAKAEASWGTYDPFEGRPDFDEDGTPFWSAPVVQEPPDPITEKQRKYLKWGLKVPEHEIPKTKKAAGRLIGELKKRQEGIY